MTNKNLLLPLTFLIFTFCLISAVKIPSNENQKLFLKISNNTFPSPLDLSSVNKNLKSDSEGDIQNTDWYSKAIEQVSKDEYNISFSEELNSYQSPNRKNNIRFIYNKDGFIAKTRQEKIPLFDVRDKNIREEDKKYEKIPEWSIDFKTRDVRRETQNGNYEFGIRNSEFKNFDGSEMKVDKNKASIENNYMRIDYTNTKEGMRQDFTIKNRPEGEGTLRLNLSADTKLKMIVGADALMFKDNAGRDIMKYSSLKCWDANGKELRAYFESSFKLQVSSYKLKDEKDKSKIANHDKLTNQQINQFTICVNDEDAVYPITIDPLSSSSNWSAESDQPSAQFGISVSTAGDVNGDGFSDVIVGANKFDDGQTDEGKAFVYYGSSTGLSNSANWNAESNQNNAEFGFRVATAGDVNGDGFSDVIVGANKYDSGQTDEGRVFVYHGSASGLSLTHNWSAESNQASALFGNSVSSAGDVNGDGYSDIIIGSHLFDNGQSNEGRAFVFHGSSTGLSAVANWTAESNQANAFFGFCVSTAFDVNADGYSDVIIGAHLFDNGQTDEGKSFLYLGSSTGLALSEIWSVESDQTFANYGISVSGTGDINGDGYSDIIVGASNLDSGQTDEGKVFVYHGSSGGASLTPNWTAESNQASANFGICVSTAGDVNGDGYCDVIVGASNLDSGQTDEGKVFVYNGSANGLSNSPDWTSESNQASASFGISASTAGDVNGDGFSDVIVGAYLYDNGQSDEGKVFAYYGSASNLSLTQNWSGESNQSNANFGWSVSGAGDVNGDSYSDVVVGAPYFDNGQTDEGRAYLYLGSSSGLSTIENWTAESNQGSALFGHSVSTAGDVNGDGYSDVIIGAPYLDSGQADEGRVFVYLGSATGLSTIPHWMVESNQANAHFGNNVSTAGDVNGDGFSDVIVGARYYDNGHVDEGRANVYLGSATGLSTIPNWTAESNQASANFGWCVATAGDVNGDGFSDVIGGARLYDNGQTNEGKAYLYLGSSSGLSIIENWTAEPNVSDSEFGTSVSTAGDVNGDGYSDVIVGAPWLDNGQTNEGRTYVYLGSSVGLSEVPNWTAESNQASALFGFSVSIAGDVNGDGYSDVIVGAPYLDNGQGDEGKVFIYLGSSTGLSLSENWTTESNQVSAQFGCSVSSAGDVNGDGASDVIVGSLYYDNGQSNEGRAFVYYGNGAGGKALVQQFNPVNGNVVSAGGLTGIDAQSRLSIFARSPFGRSQGKMIYEYKTNGIPFSGNPITNSVAGTPVGTFSDLLQTGKNFTADLTGLSLTNEYKWRARVQYKLTSNPYQKYGPWKYYNNYTPIPFSGFKARESPQVFKTLNLTVFIEGLYDETTNSIIQDTVQVFLRNSSSPFGVIDSSKVFLTTAGTGTLIFYSPASVPFYLQVKHRNSIETWSSTANSFINATMTYDFTNSINKAFGNNMKQVDASPVRFAFYSGDVNQDGVVDATDAGRIDNDASNFVTGYVDTDLTGDGFVDASDASVADNNAFNFVSKVTP